MAKLVPDLHFHVVIWTFKPDGTSMMTLGPEGPIKTKAIANKVAACYRECLGYGYDTTNDHTQSFRSRVGILEITAADPRLGLPPAREDVDALIAGVRKVMLAKVPS